MCLWATIKADVCYAFYEARKWLIFDSAFR